VWLRELSVELALGLDFFESVDELDELVAEVVLASGCFGGCVVVCAVTGIAGALVLVALTVLVVVCDT
jgi:hypothetical protein